MSDVKSYESKRVLKRVLSLIKKSKLLIVLSLTFSLFSVILSLYIPILAGNAIDLINGKNSVNFTGLKYIVVEILALALLAGILQWFISVINNKITYKTVKDLREKAFEHIQLLPVSYIDSHSHGDTVSRIITDAEQFGDGLLLGFTQLFTGIITILATLIFMISINYRIAVAVVILTPLSLFTAKFIANKTFSMFKKQSEIRGEQTSLINEMVGNQKIVQAFGYQKKSFERFNKINKDLNKCSLKAVFFSSLTNPVTRFINSFIYAVVGLTGALSVLRGIMTVGSFFIFLSYANQYTKPFNEISGVITELQNAFACAGRIFELIDEPVEVDDGDKKINNANGNVIFDNVSFSYTKDISLLKNINLNIKSGQKVAIVGPTGCGKTTLINLLMRFYRVDSGSICIDGININNLKKENLRNCYGMVLQDTWLKNGTVSENIAFGKSNATKNEIIEAAKKAHAHSFIKRMKNGYDTVIGDETQNISGGEKQLLCIARVMLLNPSILILDEATSSIDTRTEQKIQHGFLQLIKGRTSFIVAHRLSTIINSDIILVMNNGNIIEHGTHDELIKQNGFYTNLYNSQFDI